MPQSNVLTLWTQKTSETESSASAAAEHAAPGPDVAIKNEAIASAAAETPQQTAVCPSTRSASGDARQP